MAIQPLALEALERFGYPWWIIRRELILDSRMHCGMSVDVGKLGMWLRRALMVFDHEVDPLCFIEGEPPVGVRSGHGVVIHFEPLYFRLIRDAPLLLGRVNTIDRADLELLRDLAKQST